MTSDAPRGSTASTAEGLFDEYVSRLQSGESLTLDSFCAAHPTHAEELRALHAIWSSLGEGLQTSELVPAGPGGASAAAALLARYRAREGAFASRFHVLRELAIGGMGVILEAQDRDVGREVAIKIIREQRELGFGASAPRVSSRLLARFLNEARVTGQLEHPSIVPVHEIGVDEHGRPYFVMKLVRGKTLGAVFELARGPQSEWTQARVLDVLLRVCEALAYAHEKGVLHRDLKPSNVMVGEHGEVYVMDWGIARRIGEPDVATDASDASPEPIAAAQTADGGVVGTPSYMSPEQALGDRARMGPRSDVYAVGAMLYHLCAGRAPFQHSDESDTPTAIRERVVTEELEALPAATPPEVQAICAKAMERDLDKRYADMREFAEDLRSFLLGRTVKAYETGAWAEAKKWFQRNRAIALVSAAAAVILVGGVTTSLVLEARSENRRVELARQALVKSDAELERVLDDNRGEQVVRGIDEYAAPDRAWRRTVRELQRVGVSLSASEGVERSATILDQMRGRSPMLFDKTIQALDALRHDLKTAAHRSPASAAAQRDSGVVGCVETLLQHLETYPRIAAMRRELLAVEDEPQRFVWPAAEGLSRDELSWLALAANRNAAWERSIDYARGVLAQGSDYWAHLVLARGSLETGRDDDAIRQAEQALASQPNAAWPDLVLAEALYRKGESDAALRAQRSAMQHAPSSAVAAGRLATALKRAGKYDAARWYLDQFIDRNGEDADLRLVRATIGTASSDPAAALADIDCAFEVFPDHGPSLVERAGLLDASADNELAVYAYERALTRMNGWGAFENDYGAHLEQHGRIDEAIGWCSKAVEDAPYEAQYLHMLGYVLERAQRAADAEATYRMATAVRPSYALPWISLTNFLQAEGRTSEAIEACTGWLEAVPTSSRANAMRGLLYYENGQYEESIVDLDRSRAQNATNPEPLHTLGHVRLAKGDIARGMDETRAALRRYEAMVAAHPADPKYAFAHAYLACSAHTLGDLETAKQHYTIAISLDPQGVPRYLDLSTILFELGDVERSAECLESVLAMHPENAEACCRLAWRSMRRGDDTRAVELLTRGDELGARTAGWREPSKRWIRQAVGIREHAALVDGRAVPVSDEDWLWLGVGAFRRWNFAESVRAFEHLAEELGPAPPWSVLCERAGLHAWEVLEPAAEAAARRTLGGRFAPECAPEERQHLAARTVEWLAAAMAARRLDAASHHPRACLAEHSAAMRWLNRVPDWCGELMQRDPDAEWTVKLRDLLTEARMLRLIWDKR